MRVGIIGLGYVGLPLAVAFAEKGHEVSGLDVSERIVKGLNAGHSQVEDIPDERLAALDGRLTATTDAAALAACDAILICVPTPLANQREPDLSYIVDAGEALASSLRAGQLVVLESTTYPGTTRERLQPILEASGLSAGSDFHLAFSPERIDPGRTDFTIETTPKVVGGLTPACAERARDLYAEICDEVVVVTTPEAAEMTKLLENIFRSVNIALVNELAVLCDRMGIDIWEVVDAAATKPYGFMRFEPGPGMGGHCLPVDPFYLVVQGARVRLPGRVRRARRQGQPAPAALLRRARRPGAQRRRQAGPRRPRAVARRLLQARGRRHARGTGAEDRPPAARARRRGRVSRPPRARVARARTRIRRARPTQLAGCDVACVITAHGEVDYAEVVGDGAPGASTSAASTRGIAAENLIRL